MEISQKSMQWLMRLTFVVWLVHFYVFDASIIDQRPIAFLAIAMIALTLMTSLGVVISIARTGSLASSDQENSFNFQPIAQSAFFAAILLISLFSLDQTKQSVQKQMVQLSHQTSLTLHPSILKKLNNVKSEKQGKFMARMIYRSHSVAMPYRLDQKTVFYTPNDQDIQAANHNRKRVIAASRQHDQLTTKLTELHILFYGQLLLTFLVICAVLGLIQIGTIKY